MKTLNEVIERAKADIAKKYVYVMMPIPQLQTLLDGVEALQQEVELLRRERNLLAGGKPHEG